MASESKPFEHSYKGLKPLAGTLTLSLFERRLLMRPKTILVSSVALLLVLSFFALQLADNPTRHVGVAYAQQKMTEEKSMQGEKLVVIRKDLAKAKRELTGDGKYNCCIRPTCDFCALAVDKCPCALNLAKGMPVCGTCAGGWAAGYGVVPDVDAADVEAITGKMAKMMYDMRAMHSGKKMEEK